MFTEKIPADPTALQRQQRRIRKLKAQGVTRSTIFVHEDCKPSLDDLRPLFFESSGSKLLATLVKEIRTAKKPINVAQVPQLSPFRYPGGKTWLVPQIRDWLKTSLRSIDVFVEPFAGGAMAGLTVAAEDLAYSVMLSEIDADVAAVWNTIFDGSEADISWLSNRILNFKVNLEEVQRVLDKSGKTMRERAFRTIIKNRMQRGGIMAAGAGLVRAGEAGRGLNSRWYPDTLVKRIRVLRLLRNRITFQRCDAFQTIEQFSNNPNAAFFVDPPYTAGGKKAGSRLYTHNDVDHEKLFDAMASVRGAVMLSYDDSPEVRSLARRHSFRVETIPMKNTHHAVIHELLILKP